MDIPRNTLKKRNLTGLIAAYTLALLWPLLDLTNDLPQALILVTMIFLSILLLFTYYHYNSSSKSKISDYSDSQLLLQTNSPRQVYPIIIVLAPDLIKTQKNICIRQALEEFNTYLHSQLGVELAHIYIIQGNLPPNSYQILINEILSVEVTAYSDFVLVPNSKVRSIIEAEYRFRNMVPLGQLELGYWVSIEKIECLTDLKIRYLSGEKFMLEQLRYCLVMNLDNLISSDDIKVWLTTMTNHQDLIDELLTLIPLKQISQIIKPLLVAQIPLHNSKLILETLVAWAPKESNPLLLSEHLRVAMATYIGQRHQTNGKIYAIAINSEVEDSITQALHYTNEGFSLELHESLYDYFIEKLLNILEQQPLQNTLVIITRLAIRHAVAAIIGEKYTIAILSREEVAASGLKLKIVDFIY